MTSNLNSILRRELLNVENLIHRFKMKVPVVSEYLTSTDALLLRLNNNIAEQVHEMEVNCDKQDVRLNVLDPEATIARGFSVIEKSFKGEKIVVTRIQDVTPDEVLDVSVKDGTFPVKVV